MAKVVVWEVDDSGMHTVTHGKWVLEFLQNRVMKMVKHLTTAVFVKVVEEICPEGREWILWIRHASFQQYVWRQLFLPD